MNVSESRRVGWYDALDQAVRFTFAAQIVRPGDVVLDVGCGLGHLANFLEDVTYIGVDLHDSLLEEARTSGGDFRSFCKLDYMNERLPKADSVIAIGSLLGLGNSALQFLNAIKLASRARWMLICANENAPLSLTASHEFVSFPNEWGDEFSRYETYASNVEGFLSPLDCLRELLQGEFSGWDRVSVSRCFWMLGDEGMALRAIAGVDSEGAALMRERLSTTSA